MNEKTIGEVSKFTGVSPHTIKYYEKLGLISSSRDEVSNYRYYHINTCTDIYECMKCRNMDFSLKDTKILLQDADDSVLNEMLEQRSHELDEQIQQLQQQKDRIDTYRKEIFQVDQRLGKWYVAEIPDFYMKKQTINLEYMDHATVGNWNLTNAGPTCKSIVCLHRSFVNGGIPSFSWGLGGFEPPMDLSTDLLDSEDFVHLPPTRAFITYLKLTGHYVSNGTMVEQIRNLFVLFGNEVPYDVYAIRVKITHDENGVDWHYFRVLVPLERAVIS